MSTNNSIDSNIPIEISNGGTNATSMATNYGVAYYDGSKFATLASVGTASQVLTSNSAGSPPSFQNFSLTQCIVSAVRTTDTVATKNSSRTISLHTEYVDLNNNYNFSTGILTAPVSGFYVTVGSVFVEFNTLTGRGATEFFNGNGFGGFGTSFFINNVAGARETPGATSAYTTYQGKPAVMVTDLDSGDTTNLLFGNYLNEDLTVKGVSPGTFGGFYSIVGG